LLNIALQLLLFLRIYSTVSCEYHIIVFIKCHILHPKCTKLKYRPMLRLIIHWANSHRFPKSRD